MKTKTPRPSAGFSVRWSPEERSAIDEAASFKGVKPTQIIRMAVKEYLDALKRKTNG